VNSPSRAQTLLDILLDGVGRNLQNSKAPENWAQEFQRVEILNMVFSARNGGLERLSRNQSAHSLKVRHPPRSGWLDELGRLKGGRVVGLGVARGAPYGSLQNCPAVPSAASCSRMYWRTFSSSNPTVETA